MIIKVDSEGPFCEFILLRRVAVVNVVSVGFYCWRVIIATVTALWYHGQGWPFGNVGRFGSAFYLGGLERFARKTHDIWGGNGRRDGVLVNSTRS